MALPQRPLPGVWTAESLIAALYAVKYRAGYGTEPRVHRRGKGWIAWLIDYRPEGTAIGRALSLEAP
jgi:hypothetical protein